jgi:hypothetical protein
MLSEYEEAHRKSKNILQYKCKPCHNDWWGSRANRTCKRCGKDTDPLPLKQMIGIGWFACPCGRKFAGFSKGSVTSKCHGCMTEVLPSFIVPGESAENNDKDKPKKTHYCNVCKGTSPCPIVEAAKARSGRGGGRR